MHLCLRPPTTTTQPIPPTPLTTQKVLCTFAFAPRPPPPPPPPNPPHLPPRRYYAPLPSPPDHHHHPTHPAYPTYHPEGTMHLCLRPPTTTTTTTHPPIRYECVFYHRCICSIVNNHPLTHPFGTSACFITDVFVVLLIIFPCPRACLRIWSRETGSAVPSRVSLLISILRLNLVLTYGIPPEFRGGVHL